MTFAHVGALGAVPGRRDDLVALLTARNDALRHVSCLLYEVGVSDAQPDTVFVAELWGERRGPPGVPGTAGGAGRDRHCSPVAVGGVRRALLRRGGLAAARLSASPAPPDRVPPAGTVLRPRTSAGGAWLQ